MQVTTMQRTHVFAAMPDMSPTPANYGELGRPTVP